MLVSKLPAYYFGHVLAVLQSHHIEVDTWLLSQGIDRAQLIQADASISVEQFDGLMTRVIAQPDLANFGIQVGKRLEIAHHGAFGLGVLNCQTVGSVLSFMAEFSATRLPLINIQIKVQKQHTLIVFQDTKWQGALHRAVTEGIVLAVKRLLLALPLASGKPLSIQQILFNFKKPSYYSQYELFTQGTQAKEVLFDQEQSAITLDSAILAAKLLHVDEFALSQARAQCERELASLQLKTDTLSWVRAQLAQNIQAPPSLGDLAQQRYMSRRSLHRALEQEGSAYKTLLEEARANKAKQLLGEAHNYKVAHVAQYLAYADVANFRRAFKRWTGVTPSQYKQQR